MENTQPPLLDPLPDPENSNDQDLNGLRRMADLLDNRFRIPGTDIRFGLDGIIGLVPTVGDFAGLAISGYLILVMLRRGAGPVLMLRMTGNALLDSLIGVVPFLGDIFDFAFKSNRRNVAMLIAYYEANPEPMKASRSLALLAVLFLVLFVLVLWAAWTVLGWLWASVQTAVFGS